MYTRCMDICLAYAAAAAYAYVQASVPDTLCRSHLWISVQPMQRPLLTHHLTSPLPCQAPLPTGPALPCLQPCISHRQHEAKLASSASASLSDPAPGPAAAPQASAPAAGRKAGPTSAAASSPWGPDGDAWKQKVCEQAASRGSLGCRLAWGGIQEASSLAALLQLFPHSLLEEVGLVCVEPGSLPPGCSHHELPLLGASPGGPSVQSCILSHTSFLLCLLVFPIDSSLLTCCISHHVPGLLAEC